MNNNFFNFSVNDLEQIFLKNNFKKFNAVQIYQWVYKKLITDINSMTNLSKKAINFLSNCISFKLLDIKLILVDKNKETFKFLFKLFDGNSIETVVMKFDYGFSICLSTQIGCNMGCKFCASGTKKKIRDLQIFEIVQQFFLCDKYIQSNFNSRISNIVFMGIGEPFDNFDNLIKTIDIFNNNHGLAIGSRHITISTCGLVDKLVAFAKLKPQINIAISLHAANNKTRSQLMPINNHFNLEQIIKSCKTYLSITNRRLTFEYILLKGINDSLNDANDLVNLLEGILCYVNLIPYNETNLNNFKRSDKIKEFFNFLNKKNILATIRLERGLKINAACGQLRINYENNYPIK